MAVEVVSAMVAREVKAVEGTVEPGVVAAEDGRAANWVAVATMATAAAVVAPWGGVVRVYRCRICTWGRLRMLCLRPRGR